MPFKPYSLFCHPCYSKPQDHWCTTEMVNGSLVFLCVVTKDGLDVISQLVLNLQDAIQTSDELFLSHKELVQKITPNKNLISYSCP